MKTFYASVPLLITIGLFSTVHLHVYAGGIAPGPIDITNAILTNRSSDCADHANTYTASVRDLQRKLPFTTTLSLSNDEENCFLQTDSIPNYNFNDDSAGFVAPVASANISISWPRTPQRAAAPTRLSQRSYDAVLLNGVVLDLLSAGCYKPSSRRAKADGNTAIGCKSNDKWLLDPLGPGTRFGTDSHNAHTQPDGTYHYHGNPHALFNDEPGTEGSPVIGFAADGFPIYGSWIKDTTSGQLRKVVSGYTVKTGERPSSETDPGGQYDGTYIDDYEFTNTGDLDQCNGMTLNNQYGYYVTDSYPWVISCFSGTPDSSFGKRAIKKRKI